MTSKIRVAPLYVARLYKPWVYANSIGADGLHLYHAGLKAADVKVMQELGLFVNAWTVNSTTEMTHMLDLNVDGIITDNVQLLLEVLGRIQKKSEISVGNLL